MKRAEIARCVKLVGDRLDRYETIGLDTGGYALTVHWIDGGQKLFYTYDQVRAWVADRQKTSGTRFPVSREVTN